MFSHIAFGTALVLASVNPSGYVYRAPEVTFAQKLKEFRRAEEQLNTCIANVVRSAMPDNSHLENDKFTALITDSFEVCKKQGREMVEACDRAYGSGAGQKFFDGPYLDALPRAIARTLKKSAGPLGAAE